MTRIAVSRISPHSTTELWHLVADLESHPDWMKDAKTIVFVGDQRRGAGTRMKVKTHVGPFRTIDDMEVVSWSEGEHIEVRHIGLVTGTGRLALSDIGSATRIDWDEELTFPWWLGGMLTAFAARPLLKRIWSKNLERLDGLVNDP